MLFAFVATAVSLVWLLHRATRLLQIPIPTLVQLLGIDIPAPPHVSLDAITSDSVTLHWSLPDRASSVAKHVIQMNGQNVGESEKRETTVTITGLNPDQVYGVRVLAVNSNHYSAAGQLIRLRTRRKAEDLILTHIRPVTRELSDDSQPSTPTKQVSKDASSTVTTSFKRNGMRSTSSSSTPRHSSPSSHHNTPDRQSSFAAATQPYTIESLAAELEQIRSEISEVIAQHAHAEEEYAAAESALVSELATLREKRKEEDVARSQMRGESKALEESKRMLEAQKTKVEKTVKQKTESIEKIKNDFEKWENEINAGEGRKDEIERQIVELENQIREKEKSNRIALRDGHKRINELEEEIRGLIAKVKKAEMEKDAKTGDINENAFAKLLHSEDAEDRKLEKAWKEVQKSLELRYVDVFEQYRDAEDKFRKAQAVLAMLSVPGSGPPPQPVSPELSKSAKRRNRTRNKSRQPVSSPITSYPIHDPRFPDASTFNNLQFPPSFQMANLSPTTSPPSNSTSALASNNNLFPFSLQHLQNSSSLPSLYMDAMEDDLLNSGGLTSPSVDLLLPSNLFDNDRGALQDLEASAPGSASPTTDDRLPPPLVGGGDSAVSFETFAMQSTPTAPSVGPNLLLSSPASPTSQTATASAVQQTQQSQLQASSSQLSLVSPSSRPPSQYSHLSFPNHSSTSLGNGTATSQSSFFPSVGGSGLKNVMGINNSSPLLETLSLTHSSSSAGTDSLLSGPSSSSAANASATGQTGGAKTPGRGSKLLNVFNPASLTPSPVVSTPTPVTTSSSRTHAGSPILESDDDMLAQQSTNSSLSSTGALSGFSSFAKRSPVRKPLFGSVSAIGNSIGSIGQSISRKKDSFESNGSSAGASSLLVGGGQQQRQHPQLASETDEFIMLGGAGGGAGAGEEPRTPGRRFAGLFSFSRQRSLSNSAPNATNPALLSGSDNANEEQQQQPQPQKLQQAPIGTRRRSGSYNSSTPDFQNSSPVMIGSPTFGSPLPSDEAPSTTSGDSSKAGNKEGSGLSAFGSQVGNLFTGQSPVFTRRSGRALWDFNSRNAGGGAGSATEW
ncbi:hypothetical protein BZA70DRAFT_300916 [Myxozyma melibiosi]|uniref:Fibronectin type-III domain-containing protein n=1 Tax=Myxozyma melibiosi TaxID=54550 RepID=A0ABR1FCI8_9ASCO